MGALHLYEVALVFLGHLNLGVLIAHWAQKDKLWLVFLNDFWVETNAFRVVPIALVFAFNVLLIVILSEAETESLLTVLALSQYKRWLVASMLVIICIVVRIISTSWTFDKIAPRSDYILELIWLIVLFLWNANWERHIISGHETGVESLLRR